MELTEAQRAVVQSPVEARLLVTAGPGTGKTHTLIARLTRLIDEDGVSPGHEVLVLSFSRAAVREIRRRLGETSGGAAYVRALTFDSFATRLLAELEPGGGWMDADYDGRIRHATALITAASATVRERLAPYRHIFVDEIQDLVGERAALVQALLTTIDAGFSLFGDPAQGIYTFQLEPEARMQGARALYDWIEERFDGVVTRHTLGEPHRFEAPSARRALWAGPLLNAAAPNYSAILTRLQDTFAALTCVGDLEAAAARIRSLGLRTAILTRTNGEALLVSRSLHELGVAHIHRRAATDRVVPGWIASVLRGLDANRIGRSAFLAHSTQITHAPPIDPEEAWWRLKLIDGPPRDSLDVGRVADAVRGGYLPDELLEAQDGQVTVSTVHRAKGLEFDCVAVVESGGLRDAPGEADIAEEARVLYVALTRPKRVLCRIERPKTYGMLKPAGLEERWVRRYPKGGTAEFEVRGDDLHRDDPAGGFFMPGVESTELQTYLATRPRLGDRVGLILLAASDTGEPWAYYAVEHHGRRIGVTGEHFGTLLYRALKVHPGWYVKWPARIEDVFLEGVDTVAGTAASGRQAGLGIAGVWLRPRVAGLGRLRFD